MPRSNLVNAVDVALADPVGGADPTIRVTDPELLPPIPFYLVVDPFNLTTGREYMFATAILGDVLTVTRNLDGTESTTHDAGDIVRITYVAQHLDDLWDDIEAIPPQTYLHDDLTDVVTDQHHARYTDAEAIAAGDGVFLPLTGGTMAGRIWNADLTMALHFTTEGKISFFSQIVGEDTFSVDFLGFEATGGLLTGDLTIASTVSTGFILHRIDIARYWRSAVFSNGRLVFSYSADGIAWEPATFQLGEAGLLLAVPISAPGGTLTEILAANGGITMANAGIPSDTGGNQTVLYNPTTGRFERSVTNYVGPYLPLTGGTVTGQILVQAGIRMSQQHLYFDFVTSTDPTLGIVWQNQDRSIYVDGGGGFVGWDFVGSRNVFRFSTDVAEILGPLTVSSAKVESYGGFGVEGLQLHNISTTEAGVPANTVGINGDIVISVANDADRGVWVRRSNVWQKMAGL